jgi:hypothetical protein
MSLLSGISPSYPSFTSFEPYSDNTGRSSSNTADSPDVKKTATSSSAQTDTVNELTEEEKQQVEKLKARDREVRAHERAHVAAGGQYVRGGAHFEYQTGPDRKRYAVGGDVSIDTSEVNGNPRATIQKMQIVRKAALAPAQPSGQDRAVAAQASQKEIKARQELKEEVAEERKEHGSSEIPQENKNPPKTYTYSKQGNSVSFVGITLSRFCDICV